MVVVGEGDAVGGETDPSLRGARRRRFPVRDVVPGEHVVEGHSGVVLT
ncbi:hypothetical protein [Blastococcus brunescens]|uniref:Uncharacterized protein n=1 Tax=Blastococcus brunescens TaxID=1564165 RepID=A0ABZ1B930_9ACTN|nr:hypothetical protein [Blastococcus sp. BMG 8361]WRL67314.1 hypothetical protein U6N30_27715 [Blastococcus sp. BMG 8361]